MTSEKEKQMLHQSRQLRDTPVVVLSVKPMEQLRRDCDEIAQTQPGDTSKIASLLLDMILNYYADVRKQAQQSFVFALAASGIGFTFFIFAVRSAMLAKGLSTPLLGFGAGGLAEFIASINFWLYSRAARQFASFHICLERSNRFLLANTICENLAEPDRDQMRRQLVEIIASAPMLTIDAVTGERHTPTGNKNTLEAR